MKVSKISDEKVEVRFDYSDYESIGFRTLIDSVSKFLNDNLKIIDLSFREQSPEEIQKNQGPELIIIPHYIIDCLLTDILWLVEKGISFTISNYQNQ